LFEKKGQGLRLTPEGRIFFDYARQIFALGDQLQDRIRDNTLDGVPSIQYGLTPGLPQAFSEALMNYIHKIEPKSPVLVGKKEIAKLLPELGDRRLDLLLSTTEIRHLTAFHVDNTLVGEFPLIVVANAKRFGAKLKRAALKGLPFITSSLPDATSHSVKNYLELVGADMSCEVADRDDALRFAALGHGAAVVDAFSFQASPFRSTLAFMKTPPELKLKESIYIVSIPRKLKNRVAEKVIGSFRLR
jgi:LysR family transcriptional activator of nhaA